LAFAKAMDGSASNEEKIQKLRVTAKRSAPQTDAGELATALERALIDLRELFCAAAVTPLPVGH
jgi:hypothetical protein